MSDKETTGPSPRFAPAGAVIGVLIAMVVVIVGAGSWFYVSQRHSIQLKVENDLTAIAELKLGQIQEWRAERLDDAELLGTDPMFVRAAVSFLSSANSGDREALLGRFRAVAAARKYEEIALFAADDPTTSTRGLVLHPSLSLADNLHELHPDAVTAVAVALGEGRPAFSDLHRGPSGLPPHLDIVAPLVDPGGSGKPLGAVVLRSDAADFLYPLIQSWPVSSRTAETLLVRRDGDQVLFLNDIRHRKKAALELRLPADQSDLPAAMAIGGAEGFVHGCDYRGIEVLAVARVVPETSWHMITKVDREEALADWERRAPLILALLAGLVITAVSTTLLLWQRNAKSYFKTLYETEAAHRLTEARYTATLLSLGDGVIAADPEGRVELMNPVAEELTGWPQAEARGRTIDEVFRIVRETDRAPAESPVEKILREGRIGGLANHTLLVARDGSERPIANTGAPIRDPENQVFGAVIVFRDLTEERNAIAELRDGERRYRLLADNTLDVIWQMDLEARFTYVNPAIQQLFGYAPEEFIGTSLADHCDPEHLEELLEVIAHELEALGDHDGVVVETVMLHRDGHEIPVEVHGKVLTDESGAPVALQGTTRDLGERKRFEDQLLKSQKLEAVGRLAGGVAHDFNNMLQAIVGHTEIAIEKGGGDASLLATLQEILEAARRSADLTRRLLGFARRQPTQPAVLDLNDAVARMLTMLRPIIGEDIDLLWKPGDGLWPVFLDPSQLDQILTNLAANARDAIAGVGKVVIESANASFEAEYCAGHADVKPGEYVMLAVSDNGCGMDRETLDHVFEPFYTTKEKGAGTGLGLATVYGIVRQNAGFVNVYSEPDGGTTFKIYLPRCRKDQTEAPFSGRTQASYPRGDETVLVVEDEPSILSMCQQMFERLGYSVLTAGTPGDALRTVEEYRGPIHLLLTDVVMPEMTGLELAHTLQESNTALKCLYMSGYTGSAVAQRDILDQGLKFIQKPFSLNDLADRVREVLDES